jgi:isoleucyl-tRNA synthetase
LKGISDSYRKVRNTFRYLLNNLSDFDPKKDSVPLKDLAEIDRWALHRLQEEIRDALKAYEEYQFHRVTARLVNFCNADLSSFYLDVIKDRLYCDPAASRSRRAAQTVLYKLSDALFRILAPILGFTADECWRFLGRPESVVCADFPAVETAFVDGQLASDWQVLLTLRESVLAELEKARAAGRLKAPREAKAKIRIKGADYAALLKRYEGQLGSFLGISQADVTLDPGAANTQIEIDRAEGKKCERCWIYKKDVGVKADRPDICGRCADAVQEWEKLCAV